MFLIYLILPETAFEVQWSEFLARDQEVRGSIPSAIRFAVKFSEK
jgi:hypothetical protein